MTKEEKKKMKNVLDKIDRIAKSFADEKDWMTAMHYWGVKALIEVEFERELK